MIGQPRICSTIQEVFFRVFTHTQPSRCPYMQQCPKTIQEPIEFLGLHTCHIICSRSELHQNMSKSGRAQGCGFNHKPGKLVHNIKPIIAKRNEPQELSTSRSVQRTLLLAQCFFCTSQLGRRRMYSWSSGGLAIRRSMFVKNICDIRLSRPGVN